MEIFLLGAGKPAHGISPVALKNIALDNKVMDWQIHSFESTASIENIYYLGGYHVEDVIQQYPNLNFTVNPNWQNQSALSTFLNAPFSGCAAIVSYSDTVFRPDTIENMVAVDADVVVCIDSLWKQRYKNRSKQDLETAETLITKHDMVVEFTGLICFHPKVIKFLQSQNETKIGLNMLDLIHYLKNNGFNIREYDVEGHWAEFNSPNDIAKFILGTKAETLARLEPRVTKSIIGKQVSFTVSQWTNDPHAIIQKIIDRFGKTKLIIRSSSKGEDNWFSSNAGGYVSLLNIDSDKQEDLIAAIGTVILSYGEKNHGSDQVLVQQQLSNVTASGVVFTCGLETGSPYYRFNFDDVSDSTESVTAGTNNELRTIIISRFGTQYLEFVEPRMVKVLTAIQELEQLLGYDKLDVEFAIDATNQVHIFQVRPITVDHSQYEIDLSLIENNLADCKVFYESQQTPSPFVFGEKTLFANMPDWNPAEIIGTSPKPLAFSLYRQLITNEVWGKQRAEFGYRDTQPCHLIYSFSGQPYVDVRASINSFIPKNLTDETTNRLANAYVQILSDNPQFHDKIEFEVLFTIWTPQISKKATTRFKGYDVNQKDIDVLEKGLKTITRDALIRLDNDIESIEKLSPRRKAILASKISAADKIVALTKDCKKYGTLAFSHAARAGFVATTILKSLVDSGSLSSQRRLSFLNSFNTVAGDFEKDKYAHSLNKISDKELIDSYGHLRPGTYEIATQAYWENAKCYLHTETAHQPINNPDFEFTDSEKQGLKNYLTELGSLLSEDELHQYLMRAIQAREWVKFEFTKNLSSILDVCVKLGNERGISRNDLSFLQYNDFLKFSLNVINTAQMKQLITIRKQRYIATLTIELPSLIQTSSDLYAFERFNSLPNFVTMNRIEATVQELTSVKQNNLKGLLIMIPQADPGYDWLFGHEIAGLITMYGGANSHMAIRAAEIDLPAAIGVGEKLYEKISTMKKIEMDCANQIIREIY